MIIQTFFNQGINLITIIIRIYKYKFNLKSYNLINLLTKKMILLLEKIFILTNSNIMKQ